MDTDNSADSPLPIPDELLGNDARRVRLAGKNGWYGVFLGVVGICIGVYGLGSYFHEIGVQMPRRAILRGQGREIRGVVTKIDETRHAGLFVDYSFAVGGRSYSGRANVPDRAQKGLTDSGPISIRYLPSNPNINHPAGWEWSALADMNVVPFVVFFALVGVLCLGFVWREREILRRGKPTQGVVIDCEPYWGMYRVSYRFSTDTGELMEGRSQSETSYETDRKILILYLPGNPKRNRSYSLSYFSVVAS